MADTRRLNELRPDIRLPQGDLVVALSGGADSGALAWLCVEANRALRAVHVDHGLTHSDLMRDAALAVAHRLQIPVDLVETAVPRGASPEGQARTARYQTLSGAVRPEEQLLTAHTADDNVETVLINLVRGTGLRGLAGIPSFRPPNVHRPLLGTSRSVLREIAVLVGIPFVDDPMNFDQAITRNRMRTTVIPRLREINPAVDDAVSRMVGSVQRDADLLDQIAAAINFSEVSGVVRVPLGVLETQARPLADRLLVRALESLGVGPSADRLERIRSVASGSTLGEDVGDSVRVWRDGPFLAIGREPSEEAKRTLTPGEHQVAGRVFEVSSVDAVCRVAPLSRWHALFPAGTQLTVGPDGVVFANEEEAWVPGRRRMPVAWYQPGTVGYLSVFAREGSGWT